MPRGQPNLATIKRRMLQAPINIIRYLQQKIMQNSKDQTQQSLIEMNKRLMEENQRLTTQLYTANQAVATKSRDVAFLYQGSAAQMQENFNLKIIIEEQNKELFRVKNGGQVHHQGVQKVSDEQIADSEGMAERQLNALERIVMGDFSGIQ
ncbi:hypothetical protein CAEBREN_14184 [Caenorhabditis brenneri]|uniref:Uncharacterized protein n=1 Tax=Caenorhabditis brenneri TaxID=135651 RepID=G0NPK8_CAEBE|nr:hypothetical protein CAEBREN_14184 [Caenorhabditis brenneri]